MTRQMFKVVGGGERSNRARVSVKRPCCIGRMMRRATEGPDVGSLLRLQTQSDAGRPEGVRGSTHRTQGCVIPEPMPRLTWHVRDDLGDLGGSKVTITMTLVPFHRPLLNP